MAWPKNIRVKKALEREVRLKMGIPGEPQIVEAPGAVIVARAEIATGGERCIKLGQKLLPRVCLPL